MRYAVMYGEEGTICALVFSWLWLGHCWKDTRNKKFWRILYTIWDVQYNLGEDGGYRRSCVLYFFLSFFGELNISVHYFFSLNTGLGKKTFSWRILDVCVPPIFRGSHCAVGLLTPRGNPACIEHLACVSWVASHTCMTLQAAAQEAGGQMRSSAGCVGCCCVQAGEVNSQWLPCCRWAIPRCLEGISSRSPSCC